jgi:hypothetical protein
MNKLSQVPIGSNPATAEATGTNNALLNGTANDVTPEEAEKFLNKIIRYGNDDNKINELSGELENLVSRIKDENLRHRFATLGEAIKMGKTPTTDPDTGKKDPGPITLAKNLLNEINSRFKGSSKVYNNKIAQTTLEKKKKKTRGNPFRVLMGKVGKLLDHGVEKKDIVRYLAKLKYWNNETIERAVDIVRDYNKKKERKEREDESTEKTSSNLSNVKISALDYERNPEFHKRSTPELIFRACFLIDLLESNKNVKQGDFKEPADKKGAKEELNLIKKALVERGFDKEELSNLGLGV